MVDLDGIVLVLLLGCAHHGHDGGACREGDTRETQTEICTCTYGSPPVATPQAVWPAANHWDCSEYSDPACKGAAIGKPCSIMACTVHGPACIEYLVCADDGWREGRREECAP